MADLIDRKEAIKQIIEAFEDDETLEDCLWRLNEIPPANCGERMEVEK